MKYNKKKYDKVVKKHTPKNNCFVNSIYAFIFGGAICTIGEIIKNLLMNAGVNSEEAGTIVLIILIGTSALLTGLGVYDKIGKVGGAGTIVPITGFANSVVAPALEFKTEGFVLGTAAKLFTIAGPVLVFGYCSSMIVGLLSLIIGG